MCARPASRGYAFLELLFAACVFVIVCATVLPRLLVGLDRSRTIAAARYLSHRCGLARIWAANRSAAVALRFVRRRDDYEIQMFADGNRNGVRAADIAAGVDTPLMPAESLSTRFAGVRIGLAPDLNLGDDPVRVGRGNLLSFTPAGTATAGSIFIVGKDGTQFVLRVLGVTARTRLDLYDRATRSWVPH